jgi:hypothetical protein
MLRRHRHLRQCQVTTCFRIGCEARLDLSCRKIFDPWGASNPCGRIVVMVSRIEPGSTSAPAPASSCIFDPGVRGIEHGQRVGELVALGLDQLLQALGGKTMISRVFSGRSGQHVLLEPADHEASCGASRSTRSGSSRRSATRPNGRSSAIAVGEGESSHEAPRPFGSKSRMIVHMSLRLLHHRRAGSITR